MSVSGRAITDQEKSAGYWFRLGVWPFLLMILVYSVTLFMFNLAGQLEGMEVYGTLSEWYIQLGVVALVLTTFVMAAEKGRRYQTVVFDDPYRSWRDFLSVIIGVTTGIGALALAQAGLPFSQVMKVPEPILQMIVSVTEELAFRLAIPALIYIALHDSKINIPASLAFVLSIIGGNALFAVFHYASYQLTIENAQALIAAGGLSAEQIAYYEAIAATPLMNTLVSAFVFGMLQSVAFFLATRIGGSGGEWAILGVIGGHYIWNLLQISVQRGYGAALYNPWHYIGLFLIVIFLFQFAIGYFFTPRGITPGSHPRKKKKSFLGSFFSFIPFIPKKGRRYIK